MTDNRLQDTSPNQMVTVEIDHEVYSIPKGYTLATAITYVKGINYRNTRFGDARGPVCNMGVCFECSVYVKGKGNIRACMIKAEDGMIVHTTPDFEQLPAEVPANRVPAQEKDPITAFDVAIIGAGPAGLAAAEKLLESDLQIVVIDEQRQVGGQIYRHIPEEIRASIPNKLVHRINQNKSENLNWIQGGSVWSVVPYRDDGSISTSPNEQDGYRIFLEGHSEISAKQLIIATGAYDRMIPFKGWTKPGVMSAGGLQLFAKTQHFVPGNNVVLTGSHPFILIVAKQILDAGGTIKGIAFSQSFPHFTELLEYGIAGLRRWKKSKELLSAFQQVKKAKIPIWFNTIPREAEGKDKISHIKLGKVNKDGKITAGSECMIECDAMGVCYGFIASSELPRQLHCDTYYDDVNGGHLVAVDENMQSSIGNVYVAGELTGVGGAELSEIEGGIAGLALLKSLRPAVFAGKSKEFNQLKKEQESWRSFGEMLGKATQTDVDIYQLLKEAPQTYVCRCEEVTFQHLETLLDQHPHLTSMNAIKLMSRCGMGLCQGRYCERTLSMVAEKKQGKAFTHDSFTPRFPVKPVVINDIIQ